MLGQSTNFPEPQFPYLQNGFSKSICLTGLLGIVHDAAEIELLVYPVHSKPSVNVMYYYYLMDN